MMMISMASSPSLSSSSMSSSRPRRRRRHHDRPSRDVSIVVVLSLRVSFDFEAAFSNIYIVRRQQDHPWCKRAL
ncbi:hypothetical protein NFJ02_09g141620 [Pycnococcus provasolii]